MKKCLVFMGLAAMVFSGCLPGKSNVVLKSSEIRKALRGEIAHVTVTVCTETVLSNAYAKVSSANVKYTNQLEVIRSMLDEDGEFRGMRETDCLKGKRCPNDKMRMWIEEKAGKLPVFKSEITLDALLAQESVLASLCGTTNSMELCVLTIDPKKGTIGMPDWPEEQYWAFNPRMNATRSFIEGYWCGLENCVDAIDSKGDVGIVPRTVLWSTIPLAYDDITFEIVGDDDPIYVVSEEEKPNGEKLKLHDGFIKKGNSVKLKMDKKDIRFMLDKPRP